MMQLAPLSRITASMCLMLALVSVTGCGGGSQPSSPAVLPATSSGAAQKTAATSSNISATSIPLTVGDRSTKIADNDGNAELINLSVEHATGAAVAHVTQIATPENAEHISQTSTFDDNFVGTINITVDSEVSLTKLPGFTLSRSAFARAAPESISYTVYNGADCTSVIGAKQFATKVSGSTATFAPSIGSVLLKSGHSYLFVFSVRSVHVPKFWSIGSNNAINAYAIGTKNAVLTNSIVGSATMLQDPKSIAVTADKKVVILDNRPPAGVFDAELYMYEDAVLSYSTAATGNVAPRSVIQTGYLSGIGTSPDGKRLFGTQQGSRRDGRGRVAGISPSAQDSLTGIDNNSVLIDAAQSDDGVFAASFGDQCSGCGGGAKDFSELVIGKLASADGVSVYGNTFTRYKGDGSQAIVNDLIEHYRASRVSFAPQTNFLIASVQLPGSQTPLLDLYERSALALGFPVKRFALPENVSSVRAIRATANGIVYILVQSQDHPELLVFANGSDLSHPVRTVSFPDGTSIKNNGFAISP